MERRTFLAAAALPFLKVAEPKAGSPPLSARVVGRLRPISQQRRDALAANIPRLIEVQPEEARSFACNAVVVGKTVVTNTGCPQLHDDQPVRRLHRQGYRDGSG